MVSFSVLIITHGREELLMKCLDSLRSPVENWELILFANGKDLSPDILAFAKAFAPHFTLIESPEQYTPGKARNLGMSKAVGEWVFFIDDDAALLPGYWQTILPLLEDPKISVIGGPDAPAKGMSSLSLALALTLSSPFCTGATFSRHKPFGKKLTSANEIKLTSCNLWVRKEALKQSQFPEDFIRAEETLFLQHLKAQNLGMFYHPKLIVSHYRRSRLSQLLRPTFYAGFYRSRLMREKLASGTEMFWLPSIFVLLHLLIFIEPITFFELARLYVGLISFVSLSLALKHKSFFLFPLIAFLHYFIVFMYGVGFLAERLRLKK